MNFAFCRRQDDGGFVSLTFSSLYWFSGVWAVMSSVYKGTRIFTARPFSEEVFFELVEKFKVIKSYCKRIKAFQFFGFQKLKHTLFL